MCVQSVVTLDVKPWDDKTDMKELEKQVRTVEWDGLVWGLAKLVPVGYGINKLQITLVIGMFAILYARCSAADSCEYRGREGIA